MEAMDVAYEGGVDCWADLWNDVWNRAKERNFLMFKRGDVVKIRKKFQDPGDATLTLVD